MLVADARDFLQWTGAEPFSALQQRYGSPLFVNRQRTVHYWGTLAQKLPAPFRGDGTHQYLECDSEIKAREKLDELSTVVRTAFPDVEMDDSESPASISFMQNEEELSAQLFPTSEYDAAWRSSRGKGLWRYSFGNEANGLFWSTLGPGLVDIGVSANDDEFILVRAWLSGKQDQESQEWHEIHSFVISQVNDEQCDDAIDFPTGNLIVVWSPIAHFDLTESLGAESLPGVNAFGPARLLNTSGMRRIGTTIHVKPGRYSAFSGTRMTTEDAAWTCRWCRIVRSL